MARPKKEPQDILSEEFKNMVASGSEDELKTRVVSLSKNEEEVVKTRSDDTKLSDTKLLLKELSGPYTDALKEIKAKRRYVLKVLQERGK
jgi:hypothetical protein